MWIGVARTGPGTVVLTTAKMRVVRIEEARRRRIFTVAHAVVALGMRGRNGAFLRFDDERRTGKFEGSG